MTLYIPSFLKASVLWLALMTGVSAFADVDAGVKTPSDGSEETLAPGSRFMDLVGAPKNPQPNGSDDNYPKCLQRTLEAGNAGVLDRVSGCVQVEGYSLCNLMGQNARAEIDTIARSCCNENHAFTTCINQARAVYLRIPVPETAAVVEDGDDLDTPDHTANPGGGGGQPAAEPEVIVGVTSPRVGAGPRAPAATEGITPASAVKKDSDTAAADAQRDIASCRNGLTTARRCCGDPAQCGTINMPERGAGKGLESCQKNKELARATKAAYNQQYSICSSSHQTCESTCSQLSSTYQQLLSQCNGCENESIYRDALAQFGSVGSSCRGLSSQANEYSNMALANAGTQGGSQACEEETGEGDGSGSAPASLADMLKEDKGKKDEVDQMKDCMRDPSQPECRQIAANAPLAASPSATVARPVENRRATKEPNFDVNDVRLDDSYVPSLAAGPGEAPTVNTVPNNSGGGIPGGGGSSGGGGGAPKKAAVAGASYSTEVFTGGYLAGGYSAASASGLDPNSPPGADSRRRPASAGELNSYGAIKTGTDLKAYLPGGSQDPNRLKLGMYAAGTHSKEITSAFTDNWNKISVKFREKCILELTGCDLRP